MDFSITSKLRRREQGQCYAKRIQMTFIVRIVDVNNILKQDQYEKALRETQTLRTRWL